MNKDKKNIDENKEVNPKDTYPDYFFKLFGSGKDLGLEVPEDDDFNLDL